jgi:hypothetical protein
LVFLLAVNDDLQQTLARFEKLDQGIAMEPFISELLQSYSINKIQNLTIPTANKKKEKAPKLGPRQKLVQKIYDF